MRGVPCDYPQLEILLQQKGESVPQLYNRAAQKRANLYMFLGEDNNFTDAGALGRMVDYLAHPDNKIAAALYTDINILHDRKFVCVKHNPSYSSHLLQRRVMLNVPFLVKSQMVPLFNDKIETLNLWDGLLTIMRQALIYHLAEPLCSLDKGLRNRDLSKDFKMLNGIHFKQ